MDQGHGLRQIDKFTTLFGLIEFDPPKNEKRRQIGEMDRENWEYEMVERTMSEPQKDVFHLFLIGKSINFWRAIFEGNVYKLIGNIKLFINWIKLTLL
jgi:hypothetical protein